MNQFTRIIIVLFVLFVPAIAQASDFQSPEDYSRTPTGLVPANPITFTAEFTEDSYCTNATYRFWVFAANGTPLYGLGSNTALINGEVSQTVSVTPNVQVDNIRLACTDENGDRADSSGDLDSAFTPDGGSISWDDGVDFAISQSGTELTNPVTFSVAATDDTGCASQEYSFWTLDFEGNLIEPLNTNVSIVDDRITQTSSLPDATPVYGITLACMDDVTVDLVLADPLTMVSPLFTIYD